MGLVKYGTSITEIKGKVGGVVYQKIGTTSVVRTKAHHSPTLSQAGVSSRSDFSKLVAIWLNLTPVQKASWHAYAHTIPATNKFGVTITLNAYQAFMFVNRVYYLTFGIVAPLAVAYIAPTGYSCDIDSASLALQQVLLIFDNILVAPFYLVIYVSRPIFGTNFLAHPKYVFCRVLAPGTAQDVNIWSDCMKVWKRYPFIGDQFYLRAVLVNYATNYHITVMEVSQIFDS
jgi:hypothetical protein